jgi:membrane-bound metal-dependent hydrolase YbcI (DUF457 family)
VQHTLSSAGAIGRLSHPAARDAQRRLAGAALAIGLGVAAAAAVGYAPVSRVLLVTSIAGVLVALAVFASTGVAAVTLGLSLPWIEDVTRGHVGLNVAASDVLLVLIGLRMVGDVVVGRRLPSLAAIKRVGVPLAQYAWMIALILVFHFGLKSTLKSVQRLELYALPVLVGAYLAYHGKHTLLLRGYVLSATVMSVAWPILNSHGLAGQLQKNPVGGFIGSALLLVIAAPQLRRYWPCVPVLLAGLGLTASRGAVLALAVGLIVILLMRSGTQRRGVLAAQVTALVAIGGVTFALLPGSVTSRLTNFSTTTSISSVVASGGQKTDWATYYHAQYADDALRLIAAHPLTGVGVGNYYAGTAAQGTETTDPHDVILLEAAEGGYLFAVSFVLLIFGVAFILWRMRRSELAVAAAAVLLATAAHGLVDVYWVRGAPVLGWLLVGMVCGLVFRRQHEAPRLDQASA